MPTDRARLTPDERLCEIAAILAEGVLRLRSVAQIALFFTGRRHAGENLVEVLKRRASALRATPGLLLGLVR